MTGWRLSGLVLRNRVLQEGPAQYLLRIGPLSVLNLLLLAAIFTTAKGHAFDLTMLARQYTYFIPLTALSAAVGSWETELFAGLGERYLLRPSWVWSSRLAISLVECAAPVAFFAVLMALSDTTGGRDLITLGLMLAAFLALGIALGFVLGFRHEKAVNNFLTVITWILGFGPGPFFGNDATGLRVLFPGGLSLRGDYVGEWLRLAAVGAAAVLIVHLGRLPRRRPFFAR